MGDRRAKTISEAAAVVQRGEQVLEGLPSDTAAKRLNVLETHHVPAVTSLRAMAAMPVPGVSPFQVSADMRRLQDIVIRRLLFEAVGCGRADNEVAETMFAHVLPVAIRWDRQDEPRFTSLSGRQTVVNACLQLLQHTREDVNHQHGWGKRLVQLMEQTVKCVPRQSPAWPRVRVETIRKLAALLEPPNPPADTGGNRTAITSDTSHNRSHISVDIDLREMLTRLESVPA